jgi:hypothetical protein
VVVFTGAVAAISERSRPAWPKRKTRMSAAKDQAAAERKRRRLGASHKRSRRSVVLHRPRCCNSAQPWSVIPRVAEDEAYGPHRTFVPTAVVRR